MKLWIYFLLFLKASTFSFGGMSNVASLHSDLLSRGWAQEQDFGMAVAIGQASPGPNGLWVISLGYLTYGIPGAMAALVALALPPFLILPLDAVYQRWKDQRWMSALLRSLSLVSIALMASSAWYILQNTLRDLWSVPICVVVCVLCVSRRLSSLTLIGLAAVAGYLLYGLLT